jgi:hypothetical protein
MSNTRNAKRKILITIGVVIVGLLLAFYSSEQDKKQAEMKKQQEIVQTAKDYNDGLWDLEKGNFEGAKSRLYHFYDGKYNNDEKYKDAQVLAIYALARYKEYEPGIQYRLQYEFALNEVNKIPANYNGNFSSDINSFRKKVQDRVAIYKRTVEDQMKERETKVYIGDSDYKVLKILGEPLRKNRTVTANEVREQWVYDVGKYVVIENGRVTSFQD